MEAYRNYSDLMYDTESRRFEVRQVPSQIPSTTLCSSDVTQRHVPSLRGRIRENISLDMLYIVKRRDCHIRGMQHLSRLFRAQPRTVRKEHHSQ